ncbi:MAG: ribose-5-phosphate isomerase RpiA [Albidovulum sp.]
MTPLYSPADIAKRAAAHRAVDFVKDGMRLGLGTGSTAAFMVSRLGERVRDEGLRIIGVPTSTRTAALAQKEGIRIITLDEAKWLDMTIDGTDEFDPELNLIKGGGGAHLQEKVVATASDRMIVISDVGKKVQQLGAFPLPVEVIRFGWQTTRILLEELIASLGMQLREVTLRMNGDAAFISDEGNYILDLHLGRIGNARQLALVLNQVPGVVENGLFMDICDLVIIGHSDGSTELIEAQEGVLEGLKNAPIGADNLFADIGD